MRSRAEDGPDNQMRAGPSLSSISSHHYPHLCHSILFKLEKSTLLPMIILCSWHVVASLIETELDLAFKKTQTITSQLYFILPFEIVFEHIHINTCRKIIYHKFKVGHSFRVILMVIAESSSKFQSSYHIFNRWQLK